MSGFEIVGLLLALPPILDLIIKAGHEVSLQLRHLRHPETLVQDLEAFEHETERSQLKLLFQNGQHVVRSPVYDDDLKEGLDRTFQDVQRAIISADAVVKRTLERKASRPFMEWHDRRELAEHTGQLKRRIADFSKALDLVHIKEAAHSYTRLGRDVFSASTVVEYSLSGNIQITLCHLSQQIGRTPAQQGSFLLEWRKYNSGNKADTEDNITALSEILATGDASNGLLDFVGYIEDSENSRFGLVFALPKAYRSLGTLRDVIRTRGEPLPPLNKRVNICKSLAAAVLHVHSLGPEGLVHKNINCSHIMMMRGGTGTTVSDAPYLLNWQMVRRADTATNWYRVTQWWNAIYQHPTRQRPRADTAYSMDHDIFSLGVCMLEVLLWRLLVDACDDGSPQLSGLLFDAGIEKPSDSSTSALAWKGPDPDKVLEVLIECVEREIPLVAGDQLSELIIKCLTGFDDDGNTSTLLGSGGAPKGLLFITDVKDVLDKINL